MMNNSEEYLDEFQDENEEVQDGLAPYEYSNQYPVSTSQKIQNFVSNVATIGDCTSNILDTYRAVKEGNNRVKVAKESGKVIIKQIETDYHLKKTIIDNHDSLREKAIDSELLLLQHAAQNGNDELALAILDKMNQTLENSAVKHLNEMAVTKQSPRIEIDNDWFD